MRLENTCMIFGMVQSERHIGEKLTWATCYHIFSPSNDANYCRTCPRPLDHWMSTQEKEGFFKQMDGSLPVGRVGQPDEIAQAALYLITNAYTTGAILDVDGGGRLL
jgi:hypothetical protein